VRGRGVDDERADAAREGRPAQRDEVGRAPGRDPRSPGTASGGDREHGPGRESRRDATSVDPGRRRQTREECDQADERGGQTATHTDHPDLPPAS
jgi:hypothetical protein